MQRCVAMNDSEGNACAMPGGRLTQQERERIAAGIAAGLSYAEIARRVGRPTSTVSREISRNGGPRRLPAAAGAPSDGPAGAARIRPARTRSAAPA
ncbi:helix-turn-helix domain-containing protein [Streptomyces gardneri]|uniref:helix-turn-helix domain-containing protein n=1 Tax=Streptomyces gardneri TaxID=66892 RepID=UPI0035D65F3C